jgi:phage antirepressor YoqD-like protein
MKINGVVKLYTIGGMSLHELSSLFSVRPNKIKQILQDNGVEIRGKGRSKKYDTSAEADYSFLNGKILVCKKTGKVIEDVLNKGGGITKHLIELYPDVTFPSEYQRRRLFKSGILWYIDYFYVRSAVKKEPKRSEDWEEEVEAFYLTGEYSTHALAAMMKVGHKKITDVLKRRNIPIRSRGRQKQQ